jgi:hypothetical protein
MASPLAGIHLERRSARLADLLLDSEDLFYKLTTTIIVGIVVLSIRITSQPLPTKTVT